MHMVGVVGMEEADSAEAGMEVADSAVDMEVAGMEEVDSEAGMVVAAITGEPILAITGEHFMAADGTVHTGVGITTMLIPVIVFTSAFPIIGHSTIAGLIIPILLTIRGR